MTAVHSSENICFKSVIYLLTYLLPRHKWTSEQPLITDKQTENLKVDGRN